MNFQRIYVFQILLILIWIFFFIIFFKFSFANKRVLSIQQKNLLHFQRSAPRQYFSHSAQFGSIRPLCMPFQRSEFCRFEWRRVRCSSALWVVGLVRRLFATDRPPAERLSPARRRRVCKHLCTAGESSIQDVYVCVWNEHSSCRRTQYSHSQRHCGVSMSLLSVLLLPLLVVVSHATNFPLLRFSMFWQAKHRTSSSKCM